jgi:hypothetical protein
MQTHAAQVHFVLTQLPLVHWSFAVQADPVPFLATQAGAAQ